MGDVPLTEAQQLLAEAENLRALCGILTPWLQELKQATEEQKAAAAIYRAGAEELKRVASNLADATLELHQEFKTLADDVATIKRRQNGTGAHVG